MGNGSSNSLAHTSNSKSRFVQRVLITLPRLKPLYPPVDSRNPSPLSEEPNPGLIPSSSLTTTSSQTSTPPPGAQKSTQPRARRVPRSEMRALYRTLGSAELELRTRLAVDRFRDVVMEYIYATHKPNVPLPTTMQMRMHPPIARAAQDLDEVDHALKLAREAERRLIDPQPLVTEVRKRVTREKKPKKVQPLPATTTADPNSSTVPIKRKRGRPRKHPLPESVAQPPATATSQSSAEAS
jgi:hypothetical protein